MRSEAGTAHLAQLLCEADILLTACCPAASSGLLGWISSTLSAKIRDCQVAIVGYGSPDEYRAGHKFLTSTRRSAACWSRPSFRSSLAR